MSLSYEEYGNTNGPLIVWIHGGGVSGWMWNEQVQYFRSYHNIIPTLSEHGMNNNGIPFSIQSSAEHILRLIEEKANRKKVIVVGFSLGAQITLQILSLKPELIDVAIVNSALTRPQPFMKKLLRPMVDLSYPLIKQKWFAKLQSKFLYIHEKDFHTYYQESLQLTKESLIRVLNENMSFTLPTGFRHAKTKILVTVGEKERSIMKKSAKEIVSSNENCTGILIPNIGHGVSLAKPDFFNQLVEQWITDSTLLEECIKFYP